MLVVWKNVVPGYIGAWLSVTFLFALPVILIIAKNVLYKFLSKRIKDLDNTLYQLDRKQVANEIDTETYKNTALKIKDKRFTYRKITNYIDMNLCIDCGYSTTLANILYILFWIVGGLIGTVIAVCFLFSFPVYSASLASDFKAWEKQYKTIQAKDELTYEYFDALKQNKDIDKMMQNTHLLKEEFKESIKQNYYFDIEDLNKKYKGVCYCGQYFQWEE